MNIVSKMMLSVMGMVALGAAAAVAYADEVYVYVDQSGDLQTQVAATPTEAIVTAPDIAHDSGVIVVDDPLSLSLAAEAEGEIGVGGEGDIPTSGTVNTYGYITADGDFAFQNAVTPMQAIAVAPDIAYNSGVILVAD